MSSRQGGRRTTAESDEFASSTLSTASASSSSASASSAASTEVSTDATDTEASTNASTDATDTDASAATPTTEFATITATATITEVTTETITAPATGGSTGNPRAIAAGIGVGTGIAASLILLLIAAVFYRRRKQRRADPAPTASVVEESSHSSLELSPEQLRAGTGYAGLPNRDLLLGASDSDVKKELRSLGPLIEAHVTAHYHLNAVRATPESLHASLRQFGLSEDTRRMVVGLSIDPNTRHVAIRSLLALVIFSNLDTHFVGSLSLLPPAVREFFQSRPRNSEDRQDFLNELALVSWRRITTFLMHENPQERTPLRPPPSVKPQVEALVTELEGFLFNFASMDDAQPPFDQRASLEAVISQCVEFGYEVFSHPCDWQFTFPPQEKGVVVLPGLEKLSSSRGELYGSPRVVLAPEVAPIESSS
ncbi:hypothetical protein B0T10DRAFT_552444 [Thelonectria olida]|uniref:Uncharacterized protein n=1 Tax=Thelonectria olida TaxID=1576542 RepID=A0A9P8VSP4_9HYPO|nr:hypothetical protein B0T10DRAFT_552444 [Thelonectria olida]